MDAVEQYFRYCPRAAKVYRTSDGLLHSMRKNALIQAATLPDKNVETIKRTTFNHK
jgi:hypothetical protein